MQIRLIVLLAGWLVGWWLLWVVPRLRSGGRRRARPLDGDRATREVDVTVVIPARNEATSLPNLLESLMAQTVRPSQIIVVDDQSTDATAAIASSYADVTVVAGEPLPPGWTGKAWACHQAMRSADADVLVFVDADVTLGSDGLASILAEREERGGLVSVQPFHHMERAYERFSALFNIIGMMGVGAATPGRDGRSHGAFGPVLACDRTDYLRVGGHEAVRGEIVEDIAFARRFEAAGLPVSTLGGGELARFRMYPEGLGQLVEGWSKNFATGARSVAWPRLLLIGFWVTTVLVTVQSLIELAFAPVLGFETALGAALVGYAFFTVQIRLMLRQLGDFGLIAALVYPALIGVFVVVFARSAWITIVRRQVQWRGRSIPIAESRRWAVETGEDGAGEPSRVPPPSEAGESSSS